MQGHQLELPLATVIARQLAHGPADNPGKDISASYLTIASAASAVQRASERPGARVVRFQQLPDAVEFTVRLGGAVIA